MSSPSSQRSRQRADRRRRVTNRPRLRRIRRKRVQFSPGYLVPCAEPSCGAKIDAGAHKSGLCRFCEKARSRTLKET
jgi:hypothetical protein